MKPPITENNICGVGECRCPRILDPYPTNPHRSNAIPHYCKVCNIQLNSCRQAEIHANGKKHKKRLTYLHFCMETLEKSKNEKSEEEPPAILASYPLPPLQQPLSYIALPNPPTYSTYTTSHPQPLCTSSCTIYTQPCTHYVPPPNPLPANQGFYECLLTSSPAALTALPPFHVPPPSLAKPPKPIETAVKKKRANETKKTRSRSSHKAYCDLCSLSFPTTPILENHKRGPRHLRQVKSQEVLGQLLQDSGAEFSQDDVATEMRCEMCQVSVNSSHQLQAHLTGHKHRGRASKQDRKKVDPHQSCSTLTSVSISDHNLSGKKFTRRSSEDYHSYPHRKDSYSKPAYHHRSSDQIPASHLSSLSRLSKSHSKSMTIPSSLQKADYSNLNKFSRSSSNFSAYSDSDSSIYNESVRFESYHRSRSISARHAPTSSTSSSNEDEYYGSVHHSYRSRLKSSSSLKNVSSKKYPSQIDGIFHTSLSVRKTPRRRSNEDSSCLQSPDGSSSIGDITPKSTSKSTTELAASKSNSHLCSISVSKSKSSSISEIPMLNVFLNRLNEPRAW